MINYKKELRNNVKLTQEKAFTKDTETCTGCDADYMWNKYSRCVNCRRQKKFLRLARGLIVLVKCNLTRRRSYPSLAYTSWSLYTASSQSIAYQISMYEPVACSFLNGSTIAKYLSAESAVRVNTDTPILTSLAASDTLQTVSPQGQDSKVYTIDVNGTQVMMTRRSARARESMYLEKHEKV